jgi:hypothetical protein
MKLISELPEDAQWFRQALKDNGLTQTTLAHVMMEHGDYRPSTSILRSLSRMANGDIVVSGEIRVILTLYAREARASRIGSRYGSPR